MKRGVRGWIRRKEREKEWSSWTSLSDRVFMSSGFMTAGAKVLILLSRRHYLYTAFFPSHGHNCALRAD